MAAIVDAIIEEYFIGGADGIDDAPARTAADRITPARLEGWRCRCEDR
jgi:hypothetical protein